MCFACFEFYGYRLNNSPESYHKNDSSPHFPNVYGISDSLPNSSFAFAVMSQLFHMIFFLTQCLFIIHVVRVGCTTNDKSKERTLSPSKQSLKEGANLGYTAKYSQRHTNQKIVVEIPSASERIQRDSEGKRPIGFNSKEQRMSRGIDRLLNSGACSTHKEAIETLERQFKIEQKQNAKNNTEKRRKKNRYIDKRRRPGIGYGEAWMTKRIKTLLKNQGNNIHTPKEALKVASRQWEEIKKKSRERKRMKHREAKSEAP